MAASANKYFVVHFLYKYYLLDEFFFHSYYQ